MTARLGVIGRKRVQLGAGLAIHERLHGHRHRCLLLACQQDLHACEGDGQSVNPGAGVRLPVCPLGPATCSIACELQTGSRHACAGEAKPSHST